MNKNPLIPMTAITGRPTKEDIYNYIQSCNEVGISQLMIYPRSGCEITYMSEEWFDICGYFITYGKQFGFLIWLYDEFNWPSGNCKGKVMELNKDYSAKFLEVTHIGNNEVSINVTYDKQFADILNPDAVDCFISNTHEKYYEKFGEYFGNTIVGIFTDEPSFRYQANNDYRIPYYKGMEDDYKKLTQNDFFSDIKQWYIEKKPERLWCDLYELLGDKMETVFGGKLRKWCDEKNILFTGHLFEDHIPSEAMKSNGNLLKMLNKLSLPGIDDIYTTLCLENIHWGALGAGGYAAKRSTNGATAELFALGPCDMPLAKQRKMIWLAAMFGLDHYFLAISPLDARGNALRKGYFNPFNKMQPWFEALSVLGMEAEKAASYAKKAYTSDVKVRYPSILAIKNPCNKKIDIIFLDLLRVLVKNQVQWELIDEHETTEGIVFSLTETGICEEQTATMFENVFDVIDWFNKQCNLNTKVLNTKGGLADNVLIRTYQDGMSVILDLNETGEKRNLIFEQNGVKTDFEIYPRGVYLSKENTLVLRSEKIQKIDCELHVNLEDSCFMRAMFLNDTVFEFTVQDDLQNVKILIRKYPDTFDLWLDDDILLIDQNGNELPYGFHNLYNSTEPFLLKKGKHMLRLGAKSEEYKYLPFAFISGKFEVEDSTTIKKFSEKSYTGSLDNYYGKVEYTTKIEIPNHNKKVYIKLDTNGIYTKLWINQEYVGERLWEPFVWIIPEKFKGSQVIVKVKEYTSCAPLFGDVKLIEESIDSEEWCSQYYPNNDTKCGIIGPIQLWFE